MEPDPGWRSGGTTLQGHSTQEVQKISGKFCNYEKAISLL